MTKLKEQTINQRIASYRRLRGYTQNEIAQLLGMKSSTYSQMERQGHIKSDFIIKLAEILHIDANLILYGERNEEPEQKNIEEPKQTDIKFFEPPERTLTNLEENVLKMFRSLKKKDKDTLCEFLQELAGFKRKKI